MGTPIASTSTGEASSSKKRLATPSDDGAAKKRRAEAAPSTSSTSSGNASSARLASDADKRAAARQAVANQFAKPGGLSSVVEFIGTLGFAQDGLGGNAYRANQQECKERRRAVEQRLHAILAPFVAYDAPEMPKTYFITKRYLREAGDEKDEIVAAIHSLGARLASLEKIEEAAKLDHVAKGNAQPYQDRFGWQLEFLKSQKLFPRALKKMGLTPIPYEDTVFNPEEVLRHPALKQLVDEWTEELLPWFERAARPEKIEIVVPLKSPAHEDVLKIAPKVPGLAKKTSIGTLEHTFQTTEGGGGGRGLAKVLANHVRSRMSNDKPMPQSESEAWFFLQSMRRQQERDEEILELKDWIILERSLRAPIRIEWASEQVQEETKQKLPGLTSLFQTQPKPATQQYSAMTTELLENVKESLEKLEGLVKPDDKQLRTLAIQAIEHCQIDKPARKTRSSSDPEAEDGTSEDDLSKAGPRGRICQTKNFNIFATSPSFARDRSQQNSEKPAESKKTYTSQSANEDSPEAEDTAKKPKLPFSSATVDPMKISTSAGQVISNLISGVINEGLVESTATAVQQLLIRPHDSGSFTVYGGIGRWTRVLARIEAHRQTLGDALASHLNRLALVLIVLSILSPVAGIAGIVLDAVLTQVSVTAEGDKVLLQIKTDLAGALLSFEVYTTATSGLILPNGQTGGIEAEFYHHWIHLQGGVCETHHVCRRPLKYDPKQKRGDNVHGERVSVGVYLRRKPIFLGDGLGVETSFNCIVELVGYRFSVGLSLSAARMAYLYHFDDRAPRGKDAGSGGIIEEGMVEEIRGYE